jgi:hypothetical protein
MNLRLISSLVLLLLALQSAGVGALYAADMPHCDPTQMMSQTDAATDSSRDCCGEQCTTDADCALYCAAYATASSMTDSFLIYSASESFVFVAKSFRNPEQPPLKPPPIA